MRTHLGLLLVFLLGCVGPDPDIVASPPAELSASDVVHFLRGRNLFMEEEFGGNGRVCATCHLRRFIGDNFDFTPADAEEIFEADPTDPLFRAIDAAGGSGSDFTLLRTHALARIPFVLPSNITVDEADGPYVHTNTDGTRTVTVLRSTPSIENIALEENIMWDGRFHHSLLDQAVGAVNTHYQPARTPTAAEQADIAFFQSQFFTDLPIRTFAAGGLAPTLPAVPSGHAHDSQRRGRAFFVTMPITSTTRGGQCATCHSGPMLDTTNQFNPVAPAGLQASNNNFVSEVNAIPRGIPGLPRGGLGLPELTYHITLTAPVIWPDGVPLFGIPAGTPVFPPGLVFTLKSSDLGSIYTSGNPCELASGCLINSNPTTGVLSTVSFFRTSSLWGSADTGPYFHNNSADTLEDVLDHYQTALFAITALGTGNPAWNLTPQEEADIIAYMRFAFHRTTPL